MSDLLIHTSRGEYRVEIGLDLFERDMPDYDFALVDAALSGVATDPDKTLRFDASEDNKGLSACESVLAAMRGSGCVRDSVLLAIGGGVVQDVATLAASLYMRGMPWIYAPTTFMAMADSCIGGKSSINVGNIKNLIGNIYPPQRVIVDLAFTRTLPDAAIASGLAEAVKICFARGPEEFAHFVQLRRAAASLDSDAGVALVSHTLRCKQWFIEVDEFDRGERRLLNFGHTFAHAIESATRFAVPHGIAVAIGILAAIKHPEAQSGTAEDLLRDECLGILALVSPALHTQLATLDVPAFAEAFASDKKHTLDAFHVILPQHGRLTEVALPRTQESLDVVIDAMLQARSELGA
jgi:3-dehydroquinate synthase